MEHGEIEAWDYEPQEFWFPVKRGTLSYKPDFKVTEVGGLHTWYEVKGYMDRQSGTKLRRMAKYYPDERIILIQAREMTDIGAYARLIEGWE